MTTLRELHPDDAALLERLGSIAAVVDPVPGHVVELGKAVFALRRADVELMTMVSIASSLPALRAAASTSHLHFFEHGTLSIDIEATVRGSFARLVGVVTDSADPQLEGCRVAVETASSTSTVDVADGRFAVEWVPLGMVRVVLERSREAVLTSGWFEVG